VLRRTRTSTVTLPLPGRRPKGHGRARSVGSLSRSGCLGNMASRLARCSKPVAISTERDIGGVAERFFPPDAAGTRLSPRRLTRPTLDRLTRILPRRARSPADGQSSARALVHTVRRCFYSHTESRRRRRFGLLPFDTECGL